MNREIFKKIGKKAAGPILAGFLLTGANGCNVNSEEVAPTPIATSAPTSVKDLTVDSDKTILGPNAQSALSKAMEPGIKRVEDAAGKVEVAAGKAEGAAKKAETSAEKAEGAAKKAAEKPQPTAVPTAAPTATPKPGIIHSDRWGSDSWYTPKSDEFNHSPTDAHVDRLIHLNRSFERGGGIHEWLAAAGISFNKWSDISPEQILYEPVTDRNGQQITVIAGVQLSNVQGLNVAWPGIFTTDQPVANGRLLRYDPDGGRTYTNVSGVNGRGTIWIDAQSVPELVRAYNH